MLIYIDLALRYVRQLLQQNEPCIWTTVITQLYLRKAPLANLLMKIPKNTELSFRKHLRSVFDEFLYFFY